MHVLCSITFINMMMMITFIFRKKWRLRDNVEKIVESRRPQKSIWRMCIACWIDQATNTHSQYVIPIAFLYHQRLHELASLLRYPYIVGVVQLSACCCGRVSKFWSSNFLPAELQWKKGQEGKDRFWYPNIQQVPETFPRRKAVGAWGGPPTPIQCRGQRKSRATPLLPFWAFVACYRMKVYVLQTAFEM